MATYAEALSASALTPERAALDGESTAVGLRILADLLEAGLPVSRVLTAFEELAPGAWSAGVPAMRTAIREGRGLARAFEEAPLEIPPIVIGMVRAGESGGGLAHAMRRAAEHAERVAATTDAIRGALVYPAVVALAGIGALGVMVGVVLPRFATVLDGLGQQLPASTRFVMAAAGALRAGALPVLAIVGLTAFWCARRYRSADGRRTVDGALLRIPGVGTVRRSMATARTCAALSALLDSGVPVRTALRHAGDAMGDAELAERLARARERVAAGEPLARALKEADALSSTAIRLIAAGEETGRLADMLGYASRIEHARAERLTRSAVRLIEPGLILGFALLVGAVATAMLQAVYAVRPT